MEVAFQQNLLPSCYIWSKKPGPESGEVNYEIKFIKYARNCNLNLHFVFNEFR